jgi:hypothetical protein
MITVTLVSVVIGAAVGVVAAPFTPEVEMPEGVLGWSFEDLGDVVGEERLEGRHDMDEFEPFRFGLFKEPHTSLV